MSSPYKNIVSGSLKLKGAEKGNKVGVKRKSKHDLNGKEILVATQRKIQEDNEWTEERNETRPPSEEEQPASKKQRRASEKESSALELLDDVMGSADHLTSAEKAFRLAQRQREAERTDKRLALTHRQRMEQFTRHLRTLPEHFDIPKVGPG